MELLAQARREFLARKPGEAERLCQEVLAADPGNVGALNLLGLIAVEVGRPEAAVGLLARAIRSGGDNPELYNNLGNAFLRLGKEKEAHTCFLQAMSLDPVYAAPRNALANLHALAGRHEEAVRLYREALALSPGQAAIHSNLGHVLFAAGDCRAAEAEFRLALELEADLPDARNGLALCLLDRGELAEGWELYEARLATERAASAPREFDVPRWRGESLAGRKLLVWREEGVGDEIKFASCLPDLLRLSGDIVFEATERLLPLYRRSFPSIEIRKEDLSNKGIGCDFHIPIGSLPGIFRKKISDFPAEAKYLKPCPERLELWRARLAGLGGGLKAGICWRSRNRSIYKNPFNGSISDLSDIFAVSGVSWVNLQYDDCAAELAEAKSRHGTDLHVWPDIDLLNDFEGVAALVASLDILVTARTTVAALGGALGVPTLMYAAMPNVLALGREYDPWFPATRIFTRRRDEDWSRVMGEIVRHLTKSSASAG